jgi:ubiquinone/menaquinone biosynthesis C-methylase UbiE
MKEPASNQEWKQWGERDPLFGVAAWDNKAKDGSSPWTDEEFYQLGALDWQDFSKHWEQYGVNRESCLEIGCGAGRLTRQLATYFNRVEAIDVSEKMIAYAQQHISGASVAFQLTNGQTIPLADQSVCSVFSAHVFQHFDAIPVASRYFEEISRILKPGGTLMIHLPVYRWPMRSRILRLSYAALKTLGVLRGRGKRLLMHYGLVKPPMQWLCYPLDYFYDVLPKLGFADIELSVFVTKSNQDPHSFIFARKRG